MWALKVLRPSLCLLYSYLPWVMNQRHPTLPSSQTGLFWVCLVFGDASGICCAFAWLSGSVRPQCLLSGIDAAERGNKNDEFFLFFPILFLEMPTAWVFFPPVMHGLTFPGRFSNDPVFFLRTALLASYLQLPQTYP